MAKEMSILEHLEELRPRLLRILITIAIIAVFSFTFGIKEVDLGGSAIYTPYPDLFNNLSAQVIRRAQGDLLPPYVQVIQTSPGQAIVAQIYVSIFLGLLLGMPIIARELGSFVNPGLYPHEKGMIVGLLAPATVLFALGSAFSYLLVTPITIEFLYRYGLALGAQTLVTIGDFVSFVLLLAIGMGLAFQLPIMMWLLTKADLVEPGFWRENFRYALLSMIIFGALITPDGSGITMWLITAPMAALYGAAYLVIKMKMGHNSHRSKG